MIADELDLHNKRADFSETAGFTLSNYSSLHWYKHHYVDGVVIKNAKIDLTLSFPANADSYKDFIVEFIESKLKIQMEKVNSILNKTTSGMLSLNAVESDTRVDDSGVKRELPVEVLEELKKTLNKTELPTSDIPTQSGFTSHQVPKSTNIFTGMDHELKLFEDALRKSNLISIEGIGGVGKTEFSAKCIEKYLDKKKTVWFDCGSDTKFETLVDSCGYQDLIKGENRTDLAKYSGFIDLIERDEKVIFLDNFQDVMDHSFRNFFTFSERKLHKSKFVLISREHPQMGNLHISPVCLEGLKKDSTKYAKKIIEQYYPDVSVDDESLQNVCDTVNGHPLAIDFAIQLLHYGETSDNIIEKLVHLKDRNKELSGRLLDEIFNHPKSTPEEKEFLLNFSVFKTRVYRTAFEWMLDDSSRMVVLHKLIDKHMIIRSGDLYGTHPLVREFCYYRLENKKDLHYKAYEYLKTIRSNNLDIILEQEIYYHLLNGKQWQEISNLISDKGEDFIRTGHINFLKEMMNSVIKNGIEEAIFWFFYGDIAQINSEWNKSLNFFEKSFSFPNVDKDTNAMAYIRYGEILYRKGDVKESLQYFKDGLDICKKIGFEKGIARSLNDIGLANNFFEKFKPALEEIRKALYLSKEINDKPGISTALNNIGLVLYKKCDLDKALEMYKDSLEISKEIGDKERIAATLNNIGLVLGKRGDLDKALEIHKDSLEISKEIGSKKGIATSFNNMGLVLRNNGDLDKALEMYEDSLKIAKEIGDKIGIAISLNNIASVYLEEKHFLLAMENLLESQALNNKMGTKAEETYNYIAKIRNLQGLTKFNKLANEAINNLPEELRPFINIEEFVENNTVRITEKPKRNAPCPCGSGKKYKQCCG